SKIIIKQQRVFIFKGRVTAIVTISGRKAPANVHTTSGRGENSDQVRAVPLEDRDQSRTERREKRKENGSAIAVRHREKRGGCDRERLPLSCTRERGRSQWGTGASWTSTAGGS